MELFDEKHPAKLTHSRQEPHAADFLVEALQREFLDMQRYQLWDRVNAKVSSTSLTTQNTLLSVGKAFPLIFPT